ncbi:hypothetical protein V144x_50440 [Gimesia aquarii]|uniref:Uncharacterized protein n=1 Tax=Gimesia aquarii TaxID=2527964 RepID=A0A517W2Q3_9PLAN|nr:hypothetical protein V144x_50440 [Gimesia aquarii]
MNKKLQCPLIFRLTAFYIVGFIVCTYSFGDYEFPGATCNVRGDHCEECIVGLYQSDCVAMGNGGGDLNFKACVPTVSASNTCTPDFGGPEIYCEEMEIFFCENRVPKIVGTDLICNLVGEDGKICTCGDVRDDFYNPIPGHDGCF